MLCTNGRIILGAIIGLGLSFSTPALAQQLWNGTWVGMTVADVQRRFPGAHPPARPDRNQAGEATLLTVESETGGHDQHVDFMFKDGRLRTVGVLIGGPNASNHLNVVEAKEIWSTSLKQYGPPKRCRPEGNGLACYWIKDKLFIGMMGGFGNPAIIFSSFRPSIPSDEHLLQ